MISIFQNFLDIYLKNGFQSLSKKDMDLLVFYFMEKESLIEGKTNYEKARYLKISPNKFASLQLESYMRWGEGNRDKILKDFFIVAFQEKNLQRIQYEQKEFLALGKIALTIENPIEKIQLERTLKEITSHIEYTLNKEVIVLNIKTLLELIFIAGFEKEKIKKFLLALEKVEVKELLTKRDFRNITFEEYRKLLNELGFESIKEISKIAMGKIGELVQ